ncbi:MAG: hypothetical protein HQL54_12245 [Magnetococcales bacterium]|nr:hypothetical protein [Magnetococcales bacterium]
MFDITVKKVESKSGQLMQFDVVGNALAGKHTVTVDHAYFVQLTGVGGSISEEQFMKAIFMFLLDREPPSAIMTAFDISIISRYFPEFDQKISDYFKRV